MILSLVSNFPPDVDAKGLDLFLKLVSRFFLNVASGAMFVHVLQLDGLAPA